jgi:hypothetical protein
LCRYSSAVVEQLTCNQQVPSSTLGGGTTFFLLASHPFFSTLLSRLSQRLSLMTSQLQADPHAS